VGGRNQLQTKSVLNTLVEQVNSLNVRGLVAVQGRARLGRVTCGNFSVYRQLVHEFQLYKMHRLVPVPQFMT
jgi:hypothetical protein